MPKSVTCYICGRGYGTASISIHVKTCQQKWEIEQNKKPPKERRMLPRPPPGFFEALAKGKLSESEMLEINDQMFQEYKQTALEPCDFCGRTFNSEAIKVHRRICTADKPHMPLPKDRAHSAQKAKRMEEEDRPIKAAKRNYEEETDDTYVESKSRTAQKPKTSVASANSGSPGDFVIFQNLRKEQQKQGASKSSVPQKKSEMRFEDDEPLVKPKAGKANPLPPAKPKKSTGGFEDQPIGKGKKAFQPPEEINYNMLSNECAKCGRKFAMDRIDKHQSVCKVNAKPKKVKRFHKAITKAEKSQLKAKVKSNWKEQHKNFMEVINHMKKIKKVEEQGGDIRSIAPLPSMQDNSLIPCDYCGRRFNEKAHERHVKFCESKAKDVIKAPARKSAAQNFEPAKPMKSMPKNAKQIDAWLESKPEPRGNANAKAPKTYDAWPEPKAEKNMKSYDAWPEPKMDKNGPRAPKQNDAWPEAKADARTRPDAKVKAPVRAPEPAFEPKVDVRAKPVNARPQVTRKY